jgi:hypothetical protein
MHLLQGHFLVIKPSVANQKKEYLNRREKNLRDFKIQVNANIKASIRIRLL